MKSALFVFSALTKVLKRFPLVVASSAIGTVLVWLLIDQELSQNQEYVCSTIAQTSFLGVAWFFAVALFGERLEKPSQKIGLYALSILILVLVHFDLHYRFQGLADGELSIRLLGYALIFHLLVAFIPLKKYSDSMGFWNYNKALFLRVFTTSLYSGVLFLGLAGAMFSVGLLFDADIEPESFGKLWIGIAGIGSTLIFLSGVPDNPINGEIQYPKGLKIFAQYILLPLVLVYLLILYVYGTQILIEWELPVGWVSNLIMAFAVVGMLTMLLLYPFGKDTENAWINKFTRLFYLALMPLLILLFVAINTRISDYGFTELRYALLWLAIWLTGITVWMFSTNNKWIVWIPTSLFLVVVLVIFMPGINAWSVSKKSQLNRLNTNLKSLKMWDGELVKSDVPLSDSISNELYEISEYLLINHGITGFEPSINVPDSLTKRKENRKRFVSRYETKSWLKEELEPYGIYPRNRYDDVVYNANANQDSSYWEYPNIQLTVYNQQKVHEVPAGKWSQCVDLDVNNWVLDGSSQSGMEDLLVVRHSSLGSLKIKGKNLSDVIPIYEPIKKRAYALWKPSKQKVKRYIRRPLSKKPVKLLGEKTVLLLSEVYFGWNDSLNQYELTKVKGKLWLP